MFNSLNEYDRILYEYLCYLESGESDEESRV